MKKRLRWLIPLAVTVILTLSVFIYLEIYYHADPSAAKALESDGTVTVEQTSYGWLFDGPSRENVLIFYPGAKVEETAYAPLLHTLAGRGMDVCLVRMPFRLALLGAGKASDVLETIDYPNCYIGGHSLGGVAASGYAAGHSGRIKGVILFASYPTQALDETLEVLDVFGSEDGVLNRERREKSRNYISGRYTDHVIEGGNHAYFGNYGEQKGDGKARITREEQQEETVRFLMKNILGA